MLCGCFNEDVMSVLTLWLGQSDDTARRRGLASHHLQAPRSGVICLTPKKPIRTTVDRRRHLERYPIITPSVPHMLTLG